MAVQSSDLAFLIHENASISLACESISHPPGGGSQHPNPDLDDHFDAVSSGFIAKSFLARLLTLALWFGCAGIGYAQNRAASVDKAVEVVATINGQTKITLKEVDDLVGPELQMLLERMATLRQRALNSLITRKLLEHQARARGLTVEQVGRQLMPERVEIDQKQVDDLYLANANRYASLTEDEAKQRIKLDLENRAKFEAYQKALAKMRSEAKVEISMPEPVGLRVVVNESGPSRGPDNAPVTIIEFSDFQCPYCKEVSKTTKQLVENFRDKVKLVYKHLPLQSHQWAFQAAQGAVCAGEQGKFWEYHDRLFESSIDLSLEALKRYAGDLGLKVNEFNACFVSESSRAAVLRDVQEAKRVGVFGTPTFVINGRVLRGAKTLAQFTVAVDEELKKKRLEQEQPRQ